MWPPRLERLRDKFQMINLRDVSRPTIYTLSVGVLVSSVAVGGCYAFVKKVMKEYRQGAHKMSNLDTNQDLSDDTLNHDEGSKVVFIPRCIEERAACDKWEEPPSPLRYDDAKTEICENDEISITDTHRMYEAHQMHIKKVLFAIVALQLILSTYTSMRTVEWSHPATVQRIIIPLVLTVGSIGLVARAFATPRAGNYLAPIHVPQVTRMSEKSREIQERIVSSTKVQNDSARSGETLANATGQSTNVTGQSTNVTGQSANSALQHAAEEKLLSSDDILTQADHLHSQGVYDQEDELLRHSLEQANTPNPEIEWRLGRCANARANVMCLRHGKASKESKSNREKRLVVLRQGYAHAVSAIKADETCAPANKFAAILLAQCGGTTNESIANAFKIRDYARQATKLDPNDPESHYILGAWAYEVAQVGWIERKIAAALFGEPPKATLQEALEAFKHAESLRPGFWMVNRLKLAQTYYALKDQTNAVAWLQKSLQTEYTYDEDRWGPEQRDELRQRLKL